jgi:hypothetical protein
VFSFYLCVGSCVNSCTSVYFTAQVSKSANIFNTGREVEFILRDVKTEPILDDEIEKQSYSPCQQDVMGPTFESIRKLQVARTKGLWKTFGGTARRTRLKLAKSG